jgi:type I restriction enzyme S subunit
MKEYKLTDVCDFQGGTQPPKSEWINEPKEGYTRMLQIRDFTQGKSQHIEYVKDNKKVNKCNEDDILIARYGASIGKILSGLKGAYNVALIKTIPDEKILTKKYLQSILKSPVFQNFILSIGTRAAQAGFNKEDLSRFKLALPSLTEQNRISEILTQAENLITQRKVSTDFLNELLKSTFLDMFGDPVRNEKGWDELDLQNCTSKIGSGSTPRGGQEIYEDSGISIIRSLNIYDNEFKYKNLAFINETQAEKLKNVIVQSNDVLFNITGASICRCTVVPNDVLPARVNQHVSILRPIPEILNSKFLSNLLISKNIKIKLLGIGSFGGAIMEAITKDQLQKFKVPVPPIKLQNQFAIIAEKIELLKKQYESSLKELENIYGVLSQKAFKGELNINKVSLDVYKDDIKTPVSGSLEPLKEIENIPVLHKEDSHIKDMTLNDYFKIPEEIIAQYGSIENHLEDMEFMLKKIFHDSPIDLNKLQEIYDKITYEKGGYFVYEDWKAFIFKELSKSKSYLTQKFSSETNQLEIHINEIKKA